MQATTFYKKRALQIGYRGCLFHSLLELKFILSIEDTHWFLRAHIPIWYDQKTCMPTNYIRDTTKKYTPDFLIRNKGNNSAWLIELKPREFNDEMQINTRTRVAKNYIRAHDLDWKFKISYSDEIALTPAKEERFKSLRSNISSFNIKRLMELRDKKFNNNQQNYFKTIPSLRGRDMTSSDYVKLVKYGTAKEFFDIDKSGAAAMSPETVPHP